MFLSLDFFLFVIVAVQGLFKTEQNSVIAVGFKVCSCNHHHHQIRFDVCFPCLHEVGRLLIKYLQAFLPLAVSLMTLVIC